MDGKYTLEDLREALAEAEDLYKCSEGYKTYYYGLIVRMMKIAVEAAEQYWGEVKAAPLRESDVSGWANL